MSKRFVYVLRNHEIPPRYYAGVTSNVARRHAEHNAGNCTHTAKYRPWSIDVVIEFADERRALAFERYLGPGQCCVRSAASAVIRRDPGLHWNEFRCQMTPWSLGL